MIRNFKGEILVCFTLTRFDCQEQIWLICEKPEIYPIGKLTASKLLACHRLTDADRRQETPGSETKKYLLLTVIVVVRVSAFVPVPQAPILQRNEKQAK